MRRHKNQNLIWKLASLILVVITFGLIVNVLETNPDVKLSSIEAPFDDVATDHKYVDAIAFLKDFGVITGYGDGLSDSDEWGDDTTDPTNADTDGDKLPDGEEIDDGTDPLNPESRGNYCIGEDDDVVDDTSSTSNADTCEEIENSVCSDIWEYGYAVCDEDSLPEACLPSDDRDGWDCYTFEEALCETTTRCFCIEPSESF